jgi:phosphoglycerate dehydrogenase-like enzyme
MKIALSFPSERMAYWQERLSEALSEFAGLSEFFCCEDMHSLQSLAPEVIIGHESPYLITYLATSPPSLKWVQFMSAGLDETLTRLGQVALPYRISNMRGIHADAMAEYFLSIALYFEKGLDRYTGLQQRRLWLRQPLGQIKGKRLLACGAGAIGTRVAEVFCELGGRADAIARHQSMRAPFEKVFPLSSLKKIIGLYDYVLCALPLTDQTRGIFNADVIEAMKISAVFVNIARGFQVDEEALMVALKSGQLRGAALDVFSTEPLPDTSPLWMTPQLLVTPHVSGLFHEGHDLGLDLVHKNMQAFIKGTAMSSEVYPFRGY